MSKYYLIQDTKKCIGCHACEIQCKSNKSLSVGPRLCQIIEVGPQLIDNVPRASYIFMPCFHCQNPWCVAACPTGAMTRREKDGIVFVDHNLWDPELGKVVKCDYCMDRIDAGLQPACVTVCTTHCLKFDKAEHIPQLKRDRYARAMAPLK